MFKIILYTLIIPCVFSTNSKVKIYEDKDDGRSSLVFVFDTTGSMYNDLKQLREGAEMILNTALEESNVIADFVFVPFHDPAVGPATVTRDKRVFKSALNIVRVYGGGDCPEMSLSGIQLALKVSRPRSYVYVFTDATASDHRLVGKVLDAVQRKQSQVVFVLTGHCNDLHKPSYKVYQQIAAASSGQVFNLNKTSVHKVLDFVRSSIKGRTVNLGSMVNPAGYNHTQEIPVDSTLSEVTVSVSGVKPQIKVVNPSGEELTGPPKLVTTLDLSEIIIVKVLEPEPGNWSITVGSEKDYSVKVVGLSNVTFNHGFSVQPPSSMAETSYRPLQGTYNHMMIALSKTDIPVDVQYAEILSLEGRSLFELPLHEVNKLNKVYLADAFIPPDNLFYIAINGRDEYNQELRRVGATAVQAKAPDIPYLTAPRKIEAHPNERIILKCNVESLVPVWAQWTKDNNRIQPKISSLQSTTVEYTIAALSEENVGVYKCVASNVAGVRYTITKVVLIVDPPEVSIIPDNKTIIIEGSLNISCVVLSEVPPSKYQLVFNGTLQNYVTDVAVEPNTEGIYVYNKSIADVDEQDSGLYTCLAANGGGETRKSSYISIQTKPTALILGPHTLTANIHSDIQLVCHIENAKKLQWIAPDGNVVREREINGSCNDVLDVKDVRGDGIWKCVAMRGSYKESDSVEVTVLIKPQVSIDGPKNITVLNGTIYEVLCTVIAKPPPRILWHMETERFLNNTITIPKPNVYKSVLKLDNNLEPVNGTYFCFGENSEGIDQDFVNVDIRQEMALIEGFANKSVELYSKVDLHCHVMSYPPPTITWYHNGTIMNRTDNIYISEDNTTVHIQKVDFDDLGTYTCLAVNVYESIKVDGVLAVHGLEKPFLSINSNSTTTQEGKSTKITCRLIKGNPEPTITWQFKSSGNFTTLPSDVLVGEDPLELSIPVVSIDHAGIYRCVAVNAVGRDSAEIQLVVQYSPRLAAVQQLDLKKTIEVRIGDRLELSCDAVGLPPPILVWTKNEMPISYSNNIYLMENNKLVISSVSEYDSGVYTCNATSLLGFVQKNFTLVVYVPPKISAAGVEPQVEVLEGQLVELPCNATGVPRPEVYWTQDTRPVTDNRKYIDEFGLRFVANLTDFGNYTCHAKTKYGNSSYTYNLYIWVPPSIVGPLETAQSVLIGNDISINCDAVGFPIPVILWSFQGDLLRDNTTDIRFNDYGNILIKNATTNHEGVYACIAENLAGVAKKTTYLRVDVPPKILENNFTGPYIATNMDRDLIVNCKATGNPQPYVLWSKDGYYLDKDFRYDYDAEGTLTIRSPTEDLSGIYTCVAKNTVGVSYRNFSVEIYTLPRMQADESHSSVTVVEETNVSIECPIPVKSSDHVKWYKEAKLLSENSTLTINNVSRNHSAIYACVVKNAVLTTHGTVAVHVAWTPTFLEGAEVNVEKIVGEDVYFDCSVDANPKPKIKWLYNSKPLLGQDGEQLKLLNIRLHHKGSYKCVASNEHGTAVRQFTLAVLVPPSILEFDYLEVPLREGTSASLQCEARGFPEPNITWIYNNTNWQVQGKRIFAANITAESAGSYRCEARNKAGLARIVYNVEVVTPARIGDVVMYVPGDGHGTNVDRAVEVKVGKSIRIACNTNGTPTPNVQWIRNGNIISENDRNISYADLVIQEVDTKQAGIYSCLASNEGGMDERKVIVDVLEPPKLLQTSFQNDNLTDSSIKLEIISGQAFYLHCHPYGNPIPEIYWFKDGLPLKLFDESMVTTEFGETIVSRHAKLEHSGNYTCVARNKVGNSSVVYLVDILVPPPTIKESSRTVTSRVGKSLTVTCPVQGSPVPNIMWIKHPYMEVSGLPRVQLLDDNVTMFINNTEVSDSGKYSCVMTNKVGSTEVVFNVTIEKAPSIAGNVGDNIVENHLVPLRRSVVLKCDVSGHPLPKITWSKDSLPLSRNLSRIQFALSDSVVGVWGVDTRDAGRYICVADNPVGTAHRRYNVLVQVPGKWSAWSQWGLCNVSCGLGYQHRSRLCHYIDDRNITYDKTSKVDTVVLDESECRGPVFDKRKCHMPPCEDESTSHWTMWSKWSKCSVSCGAGSQARTRVCRGKTKCSGDNVQIRKCPNLPRCESFRGHHENEAYSSSEEGDTERYMPEATYETRPEVISLRSPDLEEFPSKPTVKQSVVFYDVNVTSNLDKSERGACNPGYRYNTTTRYCDDIDECLIENNFCHSTQVCVNTEGGYRCGCPPGYMSLGVGQRCLDINECELDTDGCEFACVNVAGGHVCACPRPLRLRKDRRGCYSPSNYRKPYSKEDSDYGDYLSTSIEFPARYLKNTRN